MIDDRELGDGKEADGREIPEAAEERLEDGGDDAGQDEAGDEGKEGAGLLDEASDEEPESTEGEKAPRKENRFTAQMRRAKEERNAERQRAEAERIRREALERELARYQAQDQAAQQQMTVEQEAAEVAKLTPQQQAQYFFAKMNQRDQQFQQQLGFQRAIDQDRADFLAKAAQNPRRREMADKVEEAFQRHLQSAPVHTNRETIYFLLRGIEADRADKDTRRRVASESLKRETVKPPSPRGNVGGDARAGRQVSTAEREAALDAYKF